MRCPSLSRSVGFVVADKFLLSHVWISSKVFVYFQEILEMKYDVQLSNVIALSATSWHKQTNPNLEAILKILGLFFQTLLLSSLQKSISLSYKFNFQIKNSSHI